MTFDHSLATKLVKPWQLAGEHMVKSGLKRTAAQAHKNCLTKSQTRMTKLIKKMELIVMILSCSPRISERAIMIMYDMLNTKSLKRIKKDELLCSVSIMFAAREARIHYTFREVAEACQNVERKEICRVFKKYERVLSKLSKMLNIDQVKFSPMIPRIGSLLGLDFLEQKKIRKLFGQINSTSELSTLNPLTRLSVAIFKIMGQTKLNCENVSVACSVSTHTIMRSTELVELIL